MKKHLQQLASSHRLVILLGISLLLHGALLINWPTAKPVLEFAYQNQNLSINLEAIEVIGQQPAGQQKTIARSNSKATSVSKSVPATPAVTAEASPSRQSTQQVTTADNLRHEQQDPLPKSTTAAVNRAHVVRQIRHDLSQYFYYPPYARRKGMQGTVLLSFGISGQGTIHDIRIVKSSGYAILDLAAQDAMQRLEKLNWYAALMHGRNMDLELPVIFRLTEG